MNISSVNKIYRMPEMKAVLHIAASTIYLWQSRGLITQSVQIGPRAVGWPAHEIDALLAARISGSGEVKMRAMVAKMMAARSSTLRMPATFGPQKTLLGNENAIGTAVSRLRAQFASAALTGLIQADSTLTPEEFAAKAYEIADAMVVEGSR